MIAFVYTQVSPSGKGKLNGIKDSKKLTQKHLDKGLGVKNKIIPI
jgi:ribonuclease HII